MKTTDLVANRGWDRSDMDIGLLARLAFSIKVSGWDEAHPAVFETLPDGKREIRWGHRRTLAAAIAHQSNGVDDVEGMEAFIETMATEKREGLICPACGTKVSEAIISCGKCNQPLYSRSEDGQRLFLGIPGEVDVVDPHLLVVNYNDIIHSVDISIPTIEAPYVDEATSQMALIRDGMNREDADVLGMAHAIERAIKLGINVKDVVGLGMPASAVQSYLAITTLPEEVGCMVANGDIAFSVPRMIMELDQWPQRQALINNIRAGTTVAVVRRYIDNIKEFEARTLDMFSSPLDTNQYKLSQYVFGQMLEDDPVTAWQTVLRRENITIPDGVEEKLPELACEACPLKGLVNQLPLINAAYGGYACQKNKDTKWCLYNSEMVYADYRVKDSADVSTNSGGYFSSYERAKAAYDALGVPVENVEEMDEGEEARPIDKQRAAIASFIEEQAAANGRDHPAATLCENCGYRTDESPVKSDPDVPHCAWAGKRSTLTLQFMVDEKGYTIPRCLHYLPTSSFADMIPETDPGGIPEVILDRAVLHLTGILEQNGIPPLRNLTGVPFTASEHHADWFRNRFNEGGLTIGKKATLVAWLSAEVDIAMGKPALLQLNAGRVGEFRIRTLNY